MKSSICRVSALVLAVILAVLTWAIDTAKVCYADQTGAVQLERLGWLAAGAGSKGVAAGMVSGLAPQAGVTPDVAAAFIGFWLAQQGGARMGPFGEGMLIAAVGQLVRQPIEGIFGQIGKPAPTPTPEEKTYNQENPEQSLEALLAAKYGIV